MFKQLSNKLKKLRILCMLNIAFKEGVMSAWASHPAHEKREGRGEGGTGCNLVYVVTLTQPVTAWKLRKALSL